MRSRFFRVLTAHRERILADYEITLENKIIHQNKTLGLTKKYDVLNKARYLCCEARSQCRISYSVSQTSISLVGRS